MTVQIVIIGALCFVAGIAMGVMLGFLFGAYASLEGVLRRCNAGRIVIGDRAFKVEEEHD